MKTKLLLLLGLCLRGLEKRTAMAQDAGPPPNLSNGVTIVVVSTTSETATADASALDIFGEVVK